MRVGDFKSQNLLNTVEGEGAERTDTRGFLIAAYDGANIYIPFD